MRYRYPNVYFIGPMGAGKSSIGRRLAKLTQLEFIDTDEEIAKRSGVPISWIFEVEGEEGFREREEKLVEELSNTPRLLISTGGGTIVSAKNRERLSATGIVVYLTVALDEQIERTSYRTDTRPLLENDKPVETLKRLNKERCPLYESIADITYQTDQYEMHTLAKKIVRDINQHPKYVSR